MFLPDAFQLQEMPNQPLYNNAITIIRIYCGNPCTMSGMNAHLMNPSGPAHRVSIGHASDRSKYLGMLAGGGYRP